MPDNFVASWSVDRGRSYELDKTDTGTASVQTNDVDGLLDPTNLSSPYAGDLDPLKPAAIALHNPVTDNWQTVFSGFVEEYNFDLDPSEVVTRTEIRLVDAFDVLANFEMEPGQVGEDPPAGSEGDCYYPIQEVDARIVQLLFDADWPAALYDIFSGNVELKAVVYSPHTPILSAIQDAADGEFPGVANVYVSKTGIVTFHGRQARFNPTEPTYGINAWKCGDGAAVAASVSDTAQIRGLEFNRGKERIINSALATPQGIADSDIEAQLVTDATSITKYGVRSWSAENLLTNAGLNDGFGALAETRLFADYYVTNMKDPQTRVSQVTFRSLPPNDARAPALWNLLCNVEISDTISITTTHPGGGGLDEEPYFVEGIHYDVKPLNPAYHDVTLTLDLSPAAFYNTNTFVGDLP